MVVIHSSFKSPSDWDIRILDNYCKWTATIPSVYLYNRGWLTCLRSTSRSLHRLVVLGNCAHTTSPNHPINGLRITDSQEIGWKGPNTKLTIDDDNGRSIRINNLQNHKKYHEVPFKGIGLSIADFPFPIMRMISHSNNDSILDPISSHPQLSSVMFPPNPPFRRLISEPSHVSNFDASPNHHFYPDLIAWLTLQLSEAEFRKHKNIETTYLQEPWSIFARLFHITESIPLQSLHARWLLDPLLKLVLLWVYGKPL